MDEAEIVNIFSEFSKLEVDFLLEEIVACYEEIGENLKQIKFENLRKNIIFSSNNK